MSTFMANKGNIERKWYILDAANKPLGKAAAAAATLLRGKHKPEFTPNADCGDFVIIINAEKAVLTGKKLDQKYYRTCLLYTSEANAPSTKARISSGWIRVQIKVLGKEGWGEDG